MGFLKVIYENAEKKNISQQPYVYLRVTHILKFSEVLFVHIVKVCFLPDVFA